MPTTQDEAARIIRIFGEEGVSPARVSRIAQRLTAEVGEPSDNDSVKQTMRMLSAIAATSEIGGEVKTWGESVPLYRDDVVEIVRVRIKHGGFSSLHLHERKHNQFIVLSGALQVKVHQNDARRTLFANHFLRNNTSPIMIPAGVLHRFYALDDVEAVEVYVSSDGTPVDPADIVRQDEGGKVDEALLRREALKVGGQ